jgi:hypothetical protein
MGISCQFLPPGGGMIPRYVLQLLHSETSQTAREKISTELESLEFLKFFDECLTKFENNQILFHKISHRFLLSTKLGRKSLP